MPHTVKAILFDTFGTVVDWRSSLIAELTAFGTTRNITADWTGLVDAWRANYAPSMDRVRNGTQPWTKLDDLHRATLDQLVIQFGITGLSDADLDHLNRGWHRLTPWPDSIPGLTRLKSRYTIAPLSNGNVALLLNMAKHAGIPWDMICAAELFRHYKPDPETYLGAATLLGLAPGEVMMAAAHNGDLRAAQACGLKTAFFPRPTEYGPHQSRDFAADAPFDIIATDINDLALQMGCYKRRQGKRFFFEKKKQKTFIRYASRPPNRRVRKRSATHHLPPIKPGDRRSQKALMASPLPTPKPLSNKVFCRAFFQKSDRFLPLR